ncbi:MAG: lactate utilization protein [Firmicutes bacterium]|nr:lactate utilization protein [Bacillota bacterium]
MSVDLKSLWRETFRARWEAAGGHYYQAADREALGSLLAQAWGELVTGQTLSGRVVYWVPPAVEDWPWETWLHRAGAQDLFKWDATADMRSRAAACDVGLTGALWFAAETGTVAIAQGPTMGLLPTVLPPVHLIVVDAASVVPTVQEGLKQLQAQGSLPPMLKLISGPSMTADIEGTLVVGVHGPGKVGVIVYGVGDGG